MDLLPEFEKFVSLDPNDRYRVVGASPRELRNDVTFRTGSYETLGAPSLPLDFAYRADSPSEFAKDVAFLGLDVALVFVGGAAGKVARAGSYLFKQLY